MKKILLTLVFLPLLTGYLTGQTLEFRILATTDIHSHIMDYDYYKGNRNISYGMVRTSSLIKEYRLDPENTLLVDNGDLIQGNPMADFYAKSKKNFDVHPTHKIMNYLGYDVGNLGNHEFNYGLDYLDKVIQGADFPYVNANVYDAMGEKNLYTPYVIITKEAKDKDGKPHPLKIGVLGLVPPQILTWDKFNLEGKVTVKDIVDTAEKFVPEMKKAGPI